MQINQLININHYILMIGFKKKIKILQNQMIIYYHYYKIDY